MTIEQDKIYDSYKKWNAYKWSFVCRINWMVFRQVWISIYRFIDIEVKHVYTWFISKIDLPENEVSKKFYFPFSISSSTENHTLFYDIIDFTEHFIRRIKAGSHSTTKTAARYPNSSNNNYIVEHKCFVSQYTINSIQRNHPISFEHDELMYLLNTLVRDCHCP